MGIPPTLIKIILRSKSGKWLINKTPSSGIIPYLERWCKWRYSEHTIPTNAHLAYWLFWAKDIWKPIGARKALWPPFFFPENERENSQEKKPFPAPRGKEHSYLQRRGSTLRRICTDKSCWNNRHLPLVSPYILDSFPELLHCAAFNLVCKHPCLTAFWVLIFQWGLSTIYIWGYAWNFVCFSSVNLSSVSLRQAQLETLRG